MPIHEFPLAWRWTDPRFAVFPPDVLAGLHPCSPEEASRLFRQASALSGFTAAIARRMNAGGASDQVSAWLRQQRPSSAEEVFVCWSGDTALRVRWSTFVERWDDFCYPSSDDVAVLPCGGSWMLMYHHWEEFEFRPGPMPRKLTSPSALREFALETAAQLRAEGQVEASEVMEAAAIFVTGSGWEWLGELGSAASAIRKRFSVSGPVAARLARIRKVARSRQPYG